MIEFVTEREQLDRDERAADREHKKLELQAEQKKMELEAEQKRLETEVQSPTQQLELKAQIEFDRLKFEEVRAETEANKILSSTRNDEQGHVRVKTPKLPELKDKDNVDAYLERFERFAESHRWNRSDWAINIGALLTGKALDVYYRLSKSDSMNYDKVKSALLHRFEFTIDGFQTKFRNSNVEEGESPSEYITRLESYLEKWVELSKSSLKSLIVREQFLNVCDKDMAVYLNRELPSTLSKFAESAERFLSSGHRKFKVHLKTGNNDQRQNNRNEQCGICKKWGHKTVECRFKTNTNGAGQVYNNQKHGTYKATM